MLTCDNEAINKAVEQAVEDVIESFTLAMRCAGVGEATIAEIVGTVEDAVCNNLY